MDKEYKKISLKPRGFRDIYWCWNLNEPVILEYRDDKPYCVNCSSELSEDTHVFICSVFKPLWHKSWDGIDEENKKVSLS